MILRAATISADLKYSEFKSHKAWTTNLFSSSLNVSARTYTPLI